MTDPFSLLMSNLNILGYFTLGRPVVCYHVQKAFRRYVITLRDYKFLQMSNGTNDSRLIVMTEYI